jgi:hypothetical protein
MSDKNEFGVLLPHPVVQKVYEQQDKKMSYLYKKWFAIGVWFLSLAYLGYKNFPS